MIEYIKGDIFSSPAKVIVNTVNTLGVMGKGIALEYKERYPAMFIAYRNACEKKLLTIGKLMIYYAPDHWILLFPTKENWRNPSRIEYLEAGLDKFVNTYAEKNISSIAFPKLGCGNGELFWDDVKPVMESYLKKLPIDVYVYLGPNQDVEPEHRNQKKMAEWLKENARDLSYNSVVDEIKTKSNLLPITYKWDDTIWGAKWTDCLILTSGEEEIVLSEDDVFETWDDLRAKGTISIKDNGRGKQSLLALLNYLKYLSPIIQYNSSGDMTGNGYQVNEGLARVYSFKEAV